MTEKSKPQNKSKSSSKADPDDHDQIQAAIEVGQSLIKLGESKISAAMAIYRLIGEKPQEIVVETFIKGASLTPKGALTYW